MKNFYLKTLLLGAVVGTIAQSSFATVTFDSASTTAQQGNAVKATAAITISGTTMTVVLTDLQINPKDVGQLVNGFQVVVNGATGASGLTASAATIATIDGSGNYTPASATGLTIASQYTPVSVSGSTIKLSSLSTGPNYLIIGPDANNNFTQSGVVDPGYAAAMGSIAGNGPHNPFILGSETFQFTLSGQNSFSESAIGAFTFLFGTGSDYSNSTNDLTINTTKGPPSVPEPTTVIAGALMLVPLGVQAVRGFRNRKQQ